MEHTLPQELKVTKSMLYKLPVPPLYMHTLIFHSDLSAVQHRDGAANAGDLGHRARAAGPQSPGLPLLQLGQMQVSEE